MVRLVIVCSISPILMVLGIYLTFTYSRSNSLITYTVGGQSNLQDACNMLFICQSLLKFDLELNLSMLLLVLASGVSSMTLEQKILLAVGIPVSLLVYIIGSLALRYENKVLMIIFYILSLMEPAFISYKFYYATNLRTGDTSDSINKVIYACGSFSFFIWILLMALTAYFWAVYFGKGLKERILGTATETDKNCVGTVKVEESAAEPSTSASLLSARYNVSTIAVEV